MLRSFLGLDFGTLSVRAVLVDADTGAELASGVSDYPHGVMTETLPGGKRIPTNWALQHPLDYEQCMAEAVRTALCQAPEAQVLGIGLDITCDTCLPVDADNVPLCLKPEFADDPNAWVKLWKHHGAQREAEEIRQVLAEMAPEVLLQYGGQVSPEWMIPKLVETCRCSPAVTAAADRFMEAGDWIVARLTGTTARSLSYVGYKAFYTEKGWLPQPVWEAISPQLAAGIGGWLRGELLPPGECAGRLNADGAALLGLPEGIPVAVAATDALTPMPALGLAAEGDLLISIGTSSCHTMVSRDCKPFPGICGVVKDGIIKGLYGYESGQSCVGDHFGWVADQIAPPEVHQAAKDRGISVQQLLTERISAMQPGGRGLLALDWWNGVRSVLMNGELTGVLVGMKLSTRAEDIYLALIEATAYATRLIIDSHESVGLTVNRVFACGGISRKNPTLMQIYADVLGREIRVADSTQTAAYGSAVLAAVAASCFASVEAASASMRCSASTVYTPDQARHLRYNELYRDYLSLHDYFGRGGTDVLQHLQRLNLEAGAE